MLEDIEMVMSYLLSKAGSYFLMDYDHMHYTLMNKIILHFSEMTFNHRKIFEYHFCII